MPGPVAARRLKLGRTALAVSLVPLLAATPAFAAGSNTTTSAPTPTTPTPTITRATMHDTVGQGGCQYNYIDAINTHNQNAITSHVESAAAAATNATAQGVVLAAQITAATAKAAAFTDLSTALAGTSGYGIVSPGNAAGIPFSADAAAAAGVLAGASTAQNVAYAAQVANIGAAVTAATADAAAAASQQSAYDLTVYQQTLPQCDTTFSGTVTVQAGGVNVSGASIFNNNVGVVGDVAASGNVTATKLIAYGGASFDGGSIFIGDPFDPVTGLPVTTTYSSGITLGGGALSGAGIGGSQAFTGDVTAIAIGNNANAALSGSIAFGLNSASAGTNAVAIGTSAAASNTNAVAIGNGTSATAIGATAIGSPSGATTTATGTNALALQGSTASGSASIAVGVAANASAVNAVALGANSTATASNATALGMNALASGTGAIAIGNAMSTGVNTIAIGTGAVATASVAVGASAMANFGGAAVGDFSMATVGANGAAFGNSAQAQGDNTVAVGYNANAGNASGTVQNATAVGANSSAAFTNSAAFGANATATRKNQQVFGTTGNTYTMPGIASGQSRAAQSGPVQLTTTDAAGNLASDHGATFEAIAKVQAGVAVAMATATPHLAPGQRYGVRAGWGYFDSSGGGANALGLSGIAVVGESKNARLALDVGVGIGFSQFMGYQETAVAGARAGLQLTW